MKIKKVHDKPMVIHIKKESKIHIHKKGSTTKNGQIVQKESAHNKKPWNKNFRKTVFHQNKEKESFSNYNMKMKNDKATTIAKNGKSIKLAGIAAAKVTSEQLVSVSLPFVLS